MRGVGLLFMQLQFNSHNRHLVEWISMRRVKIGFADTNFNTNYNYIVMLVCSSLHMRWLYIDLNLKKLLNFGSSCHWSLMPLCRPQMRFFLATSIFALPWIQSCFKFQFWYFSYHLTFILSPMELFAQILLQRGLPRKKFMLSIVSTIDS